MELKDILSNTSDWLKFAEAKNATLIAFNSATIFALSRLSSKIPDDICYLFYIMLSLASLALLRSIISFVPSRNNNDSPRVNIHSPNILFYEHQKSYTSASYLEEYYKRNKTPDEEKKIIHKDIANQIISNAKIAHKKYNAFNHSIFLTICSIFAIIPILFSLH